MRILLYCLFCTFSCDVLAQGLGALGCDRSLGAGGDGSIYHNWVSAAPNFTIEEWDRENMPNSGTGKERVIRTFSPYFDESLIDSFWSEFKRTKSSGESSVSNNSHIVNDQMQSDYITLLKKAYGDSFHFDTLQRVWLIDTSRHLRMAELIYKASSAKSRGVLDVIFEVKGDGAISLFKIGFFPYDHSQNDFISTLSELDIKMINADRPSKLLDTVWYYIELDKRESMQNIRKKLESVVIPNNGLFTSRVYIDNGSIYALGVFDTNKKNINVILGYKLINKKFRPAYIEVLKKESF